MLNTDLHLADLEQRMTRSQFVKNTLPTIKSIAEAAADNADADRSKSRKGSGPSISSSVPNTPLLPPASGLDRPSIDGSRASRLTHRSDSEGFSAEPSSMDGCNLLVSNQYDGTIKGWEGQVEVILKDFYSSIRNERLPLHGANSNDDSKRQQSNGSLSVMTSALRRSPSVLSKAPSDSVSFRGRPGEMRSATARFTSKSRTRPRLYPSSTVGSSRTSLDDQSLWSPAASTWTKYSLGKTQTSFSVESLGSWGRGTGFPQPIGFANAINQAMIREEGGNKDGLLSPSDSVDFGRSVPLLEDETLELHGPPWAKEGLVRHKLQDKRTKDRGWTECFAVIEKGQMRLFSFTSGQGHSSVKGAFRHFRPHKSKHSHGSASSAGEKVVGGGNWLENAQDIASFMLRQTYATTLAREHSKTQAFVWALTLPTGAVHAFAVGSAELREEWISTANYWSARLSKEPLIGGVSNIEYGWGDAIIANAGSDTASTSISSPPQTAASTSGATGHSVSNSVSRANSIAHEGHARRRSSNPHPPPTSGSRPPSSLSRGSLDQGSRANIRLPGDRVVIADWRPPVSSMMASQLMEVDQRNALQAYVSALDDELRKHNELRSLMSKAVSYKS
jgi:Pleckstrin homology domain